MADTSQAQANIGVIGMAVMGSNLARNLASELGGTLVFGTATLTLRLPAADAVEVGQVQQR